MKKYILSSAIGKAEKIKATSKNVIPAKAGIQNLLTSLDSRRSLPRT